jgi:hypothetical protein
LYRRLIHLRKKNAALATGRLVPLSATSPQVAAYLRRAGDHAVLVVANLGSAPTSRVAIGSDARVLAPGTYAPRNLLGGPGGSTLVVGRDGGVRGYVPLPGSIGPRQSLILALDGP